MTGSPAEPADAAIAALWDRVLAAWEEDAPHDAALALAAEMDALAELAGRYREIESSDPQRAARARKQLDAIVGLATAQLFAKRTPRPPETSKTMTIAAALLSIALICLFLYAYLFAGRR